MPLHELLPKIHLTNTTKQRMTFMNYYAVIDTETSWNNEVISIGIVIANDISFQAIDKKYYVITPSYKLGGMYDYALNLYNPSTIICTRKEAITNLIQFLKQYNVQSIFAYNANFDYSHLQELKNFQWYDIMSIAAYKQYNHSIPTTAECCKTGRLKSGYGVENIMHMLCKHNKYCETHNALQDALDELKIMELLQIDVNTYKLIN